MPALSKFILNGTLTLITFRTEEGLPFQPLRCLNEIIYSIIARAQELYPVGIIAFTVEPNHAHFVIRVNDPEAVPLFVGYFKQETAHAINHLLGRKKRTIWADGYDSPPILDFERALEDIAYTVLNPLKDCLTASIDDYAGVGSLQLLKSGLSKRKCHRFRRSTIPRLKNPLVPKKEDGPVLEELIAKNKGKSAIRLEPYAWKYCFEETQGLSDKEAHSLMMAEIQRLEHEILDEQKRAKTNIRVRTSDSMSLLKSYLPKTRGKRMICRSNYKELRIVFIELYKQMREEAKRAYRMLKKGFKVDFPPGLFPPCLPRIANIVPGVVW